MLPHFGKAGSGAELKEGMVITIEPMLNSGAKNVIVLADQWTVATADRRCMLSRSLSLSLSLSLSSSSYPPTPPTPLSPL
jgi:methionine aminopeptidase